MSSNFFAALLVSCFTLLSRARCNKIVICGVIRRDFNQKDSLKALDMAAAEEDLGDGVGDGFASADEDDEVAEMDEQISSKQYGETGSEKILFLKFFKVVSEKADGTVMGKCLTCLKLTSTTVKAPSNLTRHLVSEFIFEH